jgi:hypothetical protein
MKKLAADIEKVADEYEEDDEGVDREDYQFEDQFEQSAM